PAERLGCPRDEHLWRLARADVDCDRRRAAPAAPDLLGGAAPLLRPPAPRRAGGMPGPASASARAMPRPRPRLPPVTSATRPSSRNDGISKSESEGRFRGISNDE